MNKLYFVDSESFNPYINLALEEYLLYNIKDNEYLLYLWQNENTIVIGKNQNPFTQCNVKIVKEEDVKIARRLSGGGAVFHDKGNLNYTFIAKKDIFSKENNYNVIINALKDIGVNGAISGRNDITVGGLKISGNAFFEDNDYCYQHGTILINTDLKKLSKYLSVKKDKLKDKGIQSVRSRVTNLSEIDNNINIYILKEAIKNSFIKYFNSNIVYNKNVNIDELNLLEQKYCSNDWIFNKNIPCEFEIYQRFNWGEISFGVDINNGVCRIKYLETDSLNIRIFSEINNLIFKNKNTLDDLLAFFNKEPIYEYEQVIIEDIRMLIYKHFG